MRSLYVQVVIKLSIRLYMYYYISLYIQRSIMTSYSNIYSCTHVRYLWALILLLGPSSPQKVPQQLVDQTVQILVKFFFPLAWLVKSGIPFPSFYAFELKFLGLLYFDICICLAKLKQITTTLSANQSSKANVQTYNKIERLFIKYCFIECRKKKEAFLNECTLGVAYFL